jgi:hypothetical protein
VVVTRVPLLPFARITYPSSVHRIRPRSHHSGISPAPFAGNKIGAIENLGATQNQFDAIDLSDNEIVKLEGFPPLSRLHTLLLNNNRIARVGKDLQLQVNLKPCSVPSNLAP